MRLFLSSENLGNYPEVFLGMFGPDKKVGLIENAKDDWDKPARDDKVKQHMDQFADLGFKPVDIDLREYFGRNQELARQLNDLGGIFVHGGNTFILRRAMAASGLDKILQNAVPSGKLIYGGSSAGSCVAAKSLHGIERGDRPNFIPPGYPAADVIWEGLALVNFMVVPHYDSDWFMEDARQCVKQLKHENRPYRTLRDGQVIVISGEEEKLLA